MAELLNRTPLYFIRYKYDEINWNGRLVGIVEPRGLGKSTMVLQRIKQAAEGHHLYVSADSVYFTNHYLFIKDGGTHLYIDEIHKYAGWSRELKQIYDMHPSLNLIFTGSSVLDIKKGKADLSRRASIYMMQGLSFREYLQLFEGIKTRVFSLDEILNLQVEIPELEHPLPYFRAYLDYGYYPFAIEGDFVQRMLQVVDQTVEVDIPQYADMKAS
mgnify:CR=1 FL=1